MGIKDKLIKIKDTVVECAQEVKDTKDLSAEDYAKYYGASYINFLNIIKKELFIKTSLLEKESDVESQITTELQIQNIKDNKITFVHDSLGQKETFDLSIIKTMLYKARFAYFINDENTILTISVDNSIRLSDQYKKFLDQKDEYIETFKNNVKDMIDNKETYIEAAKDAIEATKEKGKKQLKKTLNDVANWANNNL